MERYVWELTQELYQLGHQVEVLCETCTQGECIGFPIHTIGTIRPKPRWLALWRFANRAHAWIKQHDMKEVIIHSHERLYFHHVTTFHGPPFATVRQKPWWKKSSLRIAMQLHMEKRELVTAQKVIPNSLLIKEQLTQYYPGITSRLVDPILPGVTPVVVRAQRPPTLNGGVIGFVGKEWQRKGLAFAMQVFEILLQKRPNLRLKIIGPSLDEIQSLIRTFPNNVRRSIDILGWAGQVPFDELDVLLHPARAEPYGMVITEALAAGVPVVISDVCGARMHVDENSGKVLPLDAPIVDWAHGVSQQLDRTEPVIPFIRSWRDVALEHETVYQQITLSG